MKKLEKIAKELGLPESSSPEEIAERIKFLSDDGLLGVEDQVRLMEVVHDELQAS